LYHPRSPRTLFLFHYSTILNVKEAHFTNRRHLITSNSLSEIQCEAKTKVRDSREKCRTAPDESVAVFTEPSTLKSNQIISGKKSKITKEKTYEDWDSRVCGVSYSEDK
jgi:hypothetical protein